MRGLRGKVALVTGATGLVGRAVTQRLAAEGATVVLASRSRAKAEATIESLEIEPGARLEPCELNLLDQGGIRRGLAEIAGRVGVPTILIAAASRREGLATAPSDLDYPHFERLFGADIAGHYFCAREIVDALGEQQGASFVWLSSVYAEIGVDHRIYPPGMAPTPVQYAAVKSAVSGLVAYLAAQWGDRGVRVNGVVSGGVAAADRQPSDFTGRYAAKTMLGRLGTADEVAAATVFLASEDASYITGTCLTVDGGFTRW